MMHPKIAVIDPNTLAMLGMKQLLAQVMPFAVVDGFLSFDELQAHEPEQYYHYFVASSIVIAHRDDFSPFVHKTIVLTMQNDPAHQLSGFRSLCINVPEQELIRQILVLEQHGHAHGKNLPAEVLEHPAKKQILSNREIEVLALLAQGKINKEIADQLHISLTTVISHRKNIVQKLGIKTVSALTIYAVTHGYVDISTI